MRITKVMIILSGLATAAALAVGLVWGTGLYMAYWPGAAASGTAAPSQAVAPVQAVVPPEAFAPSEAAASANTTAPSEVAVAAKGPAPGEGPASAAPVASVAPVAKEMNVAPQAAAPAPAVAVTSSATSGPGSALAVAEAQASPVPDARSASAWSPGARWDFKAYTEAMRQSGRSTDLPEKDFNELQTRKVVAMQAIERYLARRFGHADPNVLRAFRELPREYYHYDYQQKRAFASNSYEAAPKPWAIGFGSALSDYLGQAYMTQLCRPRPGETVLEIGTGSGFQSSLLSRMVKDVYSIEIIKPLGTEVARIYKPLGLDNVRTRVGDGYFGWPEVQGGFDIIMVTCVARYVSPELLKQLKPEGRLIVPIGQPFKRGQVLYVFTKDKSGKVHSRKDVGVYFIPMTGKIMEGKS